MSSVLALVASAALLAPPSSHTVDGLANELAGVRSLSMGGAHRGLGTSNDTLYLNPAGTAVVKRYAVELHYGYSPFDAISRMNVSAVDSKSGPVAGALGYTHEKSDAQDGDVGLNRFYLGLGYAITPALALGMTGRYLKGTYRDELLGDQKIEQYNADLGAIAMISEALTLGVVYQNVRPSDDERLMPPSLGFGLGVGGEGLALAADLVIDRAKGADNALSYHVGGEYLAAQSFPVRLGYSRQPFVRRTGKEAQENLLSAGVGWATPGGSLDVGVYQSLERAKNWSLLAAFKFFL